MTPIKSSNIAGAIHDPRTNRLTCKFKDGGTYDYANVTSAMHREFMRAESKGGWLHARIISKPKLHPDTRHAIKPKK